MSSNILKYILFVVLALLSYEKVKATAAEFVRLLSMGCNKKSCSLGTGSVVQKAVQS